MQQIKSGTDKSRSGVKGDPFKSTPDKDINMYHLSRPLIQQTPFIYRSVSTLLRNKEKTHIPTPGPASNKYADPADPIKPYKLPALEAERAKSSSLYTARLLEAMGHKDTKNYKEMGELLQQLANEVLSCQNPMTWEMQNALKSYVSHVNNPRYLLQDAHSNTVTYREAQKRLDK